MKTCHQPIVPVLLPRRKMRRPHLTTAVCHSVVRHRYSHSLNHITTVFFQSVLRLKNLLDRQHPLTPNMPHNLKCGSTLSGDDASCVVSAGHERNWKMISKICAEQDLRDVLSIPSGWTSIAKRFFLSCKLSFFHSIGWHAVQLELVLRPLGTCSQMTEAPTSTQGKALSRYGLVFFFFSFLLFFLR